jgi:DNA-binding transcriptional MerR regulator
VPDDPRFSLTELADLAGVTPRTVRYYITSGLLPSSGRSGPGAKYGDEDLARLRLIRRLQREHLPLAEIRQRLAGLDDDDVRSLAVEAEPGPTDSALDYLRKVLEPVPPPASPSIPRLQRDQAAGPVLARRMAESPPDGWRPASMPALAASGPPSTPTEVVRPPATAGDRSQWERIVLAPDIELHVRRPLSRIQNKRVDRLLTIARELLEEDPS